MQALLRLGGVNVVGELLRTHWTSSFEGMSRRDRQGCDYDAYLPDPLTGWELVLPADLVADLGDAEAATLLADPAVKQTLIDNTANAAAQGVFGVPTLAFRGQSFWGSDTIAWANAFVDDPQRFESGEMRRAAEIEVGAARKELG